MKTVIRASLATIAVLSLTALVLIASGCFPSLSAVSVSSNAPDAITQVWPTTAVPFPKGYADPRHPNIIDSHRGRIEPLPDGVN